MTVQSVHPVIPGVIPDVIPGRYVYRWRWMMLYQGHDCYCHDDSDHHGSED